MDVALFSPAALFNDEEEVSNEREASERREEGPDQPELYVERVHAFPGMDLMIREFSFHQLNANLLWPGTFAFSNWLIRHESLLHGACILEIGSGTGALAIFLRRSLGVDITTSDFDDIEIEQNIAYNCRVNGLPVLPHIRHTWGEEFPTSVPEWDLVIASDILLYVKQYPNLIKTLCFLLNESLISLCYLQMSNNVKQYPNLIKTLCFLLNEYNTKDEEGGTRVVSISGKDVQVQTPSFIMSWRRRLGGEENNFFMGCEDASLTVQDLGSRVYCISHKRRVQPLSRVRS